MTLPLYVALEKIDRRLVEAAQDLYAGPWRPGGTIAGAIVGGSLTALLMAIFDWSVPIGAIGGAFIGAAVGTLFVSQSFLRVVLPLSLPGVFAGSLLTFIPAVGDYVNAELLGTPTAQMIGNVIQARFLTLNDYPTASALSFIADGGDPHRRVHLRPGARDRRPHGGGRLMATTAVAVTARRRTFGERTARVIDRYLLPIYALAAVIYLMLPVIVMILFSFNDPGGRFNLSWRQFSIGAWLNPLGRPGLAEAVANSLFIAFASTIVATILGTLIALALVRHRFRGRAATNLLIFLPMSTPEIVLGASLLTLFIASTSSRSSPRTRSSRSGCTRS